MSDEGRNGQSVPFVDPDGILAKLTLSIRPYSILMSLNLAHQIRVHLHHSPSSGLRLELAQILGSEQELSVQVALLDRVEIGDVDVSLRSACQTHHRPVLEHLAPDRTRSNQELPVVGDLLLERLSEHGDLAVVSASLGLAVLLRRLLSRERLEGIKVELLDHRVELGRACLQNFLSYEPSENGVHRGKVSLGLVSELGEHLLVERLLGGGRSRVDGFGESDQLGSVGSASRGGKTRVFGLELGEGLVTGVKRFRAIELGKVGQEELWGRQGFGKRFLNKVKTLSVRDQRNS